jgi:predicted nucleotidyltransferase
MDEPVIVWNTRHPLSGRTNEQFERETQRLLKGRVEAAYIFGSYGTNDFGQNSDVDVMLVVKTDKPFLDRALDYPDFMDLVPDMDLLVYTPEEFQALTRDPSPGFWASAVASMKRIV